MKKWFDRIRQLRHRRPDLNRASDGSAAGQVHAGQLHAGQIHAGQLHAGQLPVGRDPVGTDPVRPDPARREQESWQRFQSDTGARWAKLGLDSLWSLNRGLYLRQVKTLHENTPRDRLFDIREQQQRKRELSRHLKNRFCMRMQQGLARNAWKPRFRQWMFPSVKGPSSIPELREQYREAGRLQEFDAHLDYYRTRQKEIFNREAGELFDNQEVAGRLSLLIRATRRIFRKRQKRQLKVYSRFYRLLRSLPDDGIDERIERLARDYRFIGRTREWFHSFQQFVEEALDLSLNSTHGRNEPVIRLLQNDFLLTMQNRYTTYWRYYELRRYCFANAITPLVTRISYFEKHFHQTGSDPVDVADNRLKEFIHSIEISLLARARKERDRRNRREQILAFDHSARLDQWSRYKQQYLDGNFDVVLAFNQLRPILRQCAEWRQELKAFRSSVLVNRLASDHSDTSGEELVEAEKFVRRMVDRIDRELATDVAWKSLEQELVRNQEYIEELSLVRKEIALQRELNGLQSPEIINALKESFIEKIWKMRAPDEADGASVTPLFNRRIPSQNLKPRDSGITGTNQP